MDDSITLKLAGTTIYDDDLLAHRSELPAEEDIRQILRSSASNLHPSLKQELANPALSQEKAIERFTDVGRTLLQGARSLYTGRRFPAIDINLSTPELVLSTPSTPRNKAQIQECLKRDNRECIITGRTSASGFPLEVAHLFPFGLSNHEKCRIEPFWKAIEMFLGSETTDMLWSRVGNHRVNSLENLVTMDKSLYDMFDHNIIQFMPYTLSENPVPITISSLKTDISPHTDEYQIQINFHRKIRDGLITTTKNIPISQPAKPVAHRHTFDIAPSGATREIPPPSFWIIRSNIYRFLWNFGAAAEKRDQYQGDREQPITPEGCSYSLDIAELGKKLLKAINTNDGRWELSA